MNGLICFSAIGGSTGDVRPLVGLALALRSRGFEILVFADGAFESGAMRAGIQPEEWFTWTHVPQTFILRTTLGQRRLWGERGRYRDRWMWREIRQHRQDRIERFWRRIGGPDNPRIVAAIGSTSSFHILLRFGPQCAKIISSPFPLQPSVHYTLAPPDLSPLERWRAWRDERAFKATLLRPFCEELFHLVSTSPAVFPRPADWLPNMQVTGYTPFEDDPVRWSAPAPLRAFLEDGPPPVYVGFGSFPFFYGRRGERIAQALVEGCGRRNLRCIIHSGDLARSWASDRVYILDSDAPFAWLFPRCTVIVHHGGYGTVHAALAARRPMIIYPYQTDQFLWATRMGDLGVGPGFTARVRALTASRVEQDLARVLTPACQEHADRLGTAVSQDQGAVVQLAAIESILEHTRHGRRPLDWRMPAIA
jgi:UDP:flavonoid glycosyltransferase YjiC (YdhE family)